MTDQIAADRLSGIDVFSELSADDLERVSGMMRLLPAPVGTVVASEGDLSSTFFVVLSGTVTVHRDGSHVADLGAGDVFGEVGTVTLQPRNATVIATTPAEVAVLMGWDLRDLVEQHPSVRARLDQIASRRSAGA